MEAVAKQLIAAGGALDLYLVGVSLHRATRYTATLISNTSSRYPCPLPTVGSRLGVGQTWPSLTYSVVVHV